MEEIKIYLKEKGIYEVKNIVHNPSYQELFNAETCPTNQGFEQTEKTKSGAIAVKTGIFTGRSPKDRYIVKDKTTENTIWWDGEVNKPITNKVFCELKKEVIQSFQDKEIYVVDAFCGTNENTRLKVRFITKVAWQAHYITNMFIRPSLYELENFGEPDFLVMTASETTNKNWEIQELHSENFNIFNLSEKTQIIGGTWYAGEIKKGIFSMMNYYLPLKGIASMHCSANVGDKGDVAIFFGLSGTGKTTLSTDPKRFLIGDDEHGWDDKGVFNFEGGCYAKVIDLSEQKEPDIWRAIKRDALLENVVVDKNGEIDFHNNSITENMRVSYPIYHINKIVQPSKGGHAQRVIFLSADAYGVLPPVSILTPEQAQYHFLCGYTSKVAGTEQGITEPTPSFSAAFGEAFLTLHPTKYAQILQEKMYQHGATAYLVNTGWNGTNKRISLKETRAIIDAILDGSIDNAPTTDIPIMNLTCPTQLPRVSSEILDPRNTYSESTIWEEKAIKLAQKYINQFESYTDTEIGKQLVHAGPKIEIFSERI